MSKRKIILATLILLLLVGIVSIKLWAGEEILPGDAPTAVATAQPTEVAPGAEVSFDGSESKDKDIKVTWEETESGWKYNFLEVEIDGVVTNWSWDFGDGNSGEGATTTHTYAQGREQPYQVKLTITADHDETASTTIEVTVGPGIVLTADPQSITSGNQTTLTATAVDNNGNTDTNFNGSVDFSVDYADRLELSSTSAGASGGVATVTGTGKKVGEVTVTASAEGLISGTVNVTVKGKLEKVSGDNQQADSGTVLSEPLRIRVTTGEGNGVANIAISFSITTQPSGASGASVSPASATTGSDGYAEATLTLGDKIGEYQVTATGTNTDPESVIFTARANHKVKITGPDSVTRGQNATFTVEITPTPSANESVTYSNWKFLTSAGTITRPGDNNVKTWGGEMVASGTVSVKVTIGEVDIEADKTFSINPRAWNADPTDPPPKGPKGPSPPRNGNHLGDYITGLGDNVPNNVKQISDRGPNNGYWYITNPPAVVVNIARINVDVVNHNSTFAQNQGDPGEPTIEQLETAVRKHEYEHPTDSHHAHFRRAEAEKGDMNANAEDEIQYGGSQSAFIQSVRNKLRTQASAIRDRYHEFGEPSDHLPPGTEPDFLPYSPR